MMVRSLEGETQALIKKVAFNPEAFTYYSWAKRRGLLNPKKDFGGLRQLLRQGHDG